MTPKENNSPFKTCNSRTFHWSNQKKIAGAKVYSIAFMNTNDLIFFQINFTDTKTWIKEEPQDCHSKDVYSFNILRLQHFISYRGSIGRSKWVGSNFHSGKNTHTGAVSKTRVSLLTQCLHKMMNVVKIKSDNNNRMLPSHHWAWYLWLCAVVCSSEYNTIQNNRIEWLYYHCIVVYIEIRLHCQLTER